MSSADSAPATADSAPTTGLRERKKRERERALRLAAIELTLASGFANVTVEDICERCGVSRRTFFNYFSSKEEAILGRADTVFDVEDQPAIAAFEAGGPTGRLLADLETLLATVVRTRLSRREEMDRYHRILRQEPELMQVQMSRMGRNERLFREMIQRRLDGSAPGAHPVAEPSPETEAETKAPADPCLADEGAVVSARAEALAALAMMAIKATFVRLRRAEGDPAAVIHELFDELRAVFTAE